MDEFALIKRYFMTPSRRAEVVLGGGDDGAVLDFGANQMVVATDTLVAGRHFAHDALPADIGWKALAVNLSDLAAMGAEAVAFTLALTIESADPGWLRGFAQGMLRLARRHELDLVGGDTTQGPLTVTVTVLGSCPRGEVLRRAGAAVGDLICVCGGLGLAAWALRDPAASAAARRALLRPEPQLGAGLALRGMASAVIDVSDGLAQDLSHILRASQVGGVIDVAQLPLARSLRGQAAALDYALYGGDDYALAFCLAPARLPALRARLGDEFHVIGEVVAGRQLHIRAANGTLGACSASGYRHFHESS